jgi:hypothetical protein
VILPSDKTSERNLSYFFDIIKPRRMEHLQSEEPFSSDPYFNRVLRLVKPLQNNKGQKNLGYPRKKQFFYKEKDCFFLGTPNCFGPPYFDVALVFSLKK